MFKINCEKGCQTPEQEARVLFDDGNSNALETQDIHIASFSVVVCQFGLTA